MSGAVSWLPGVEDRAESIVSGIGLINLDEKNAGERSAGNPPAAFDVEGVGNVAMAAGLRATAKAVEEPPEPNACAPILDPTDEGDVESGLR